MNMHTIVRIILDVFIINGKIISGSYIYENGKEF